MPLESTTTISGLDQSWPLGGDPHSQGDDHLRLVKSVLKSIFPGVGGQGFSKVITATEDDLNATLNARSNFQSQIDVLSGFTPPEAFPTGTRMVFHQAAAPLGWTQDTSSTYNDRMMRIVSGSGEGVGGSDSPILMNKVPAHTHGAGVSSSGLHNHNFIEELRPTAFSDPNDQSGLTRETGSNGGAIAGPHVTDAGAHIHTVSIATNTGASDWFPKYTNLIIGVKQ